MSAVSREQWLQNAVDAMRPRFAQAGYVLPEVIHVSVGLPSKRALSVKSRVIGQCWHGTASTDGHSHVFISPVIGDGVEALDTLVHELCHVVAGPEAKHGAGFVKVGNAVGLTEGKPTSLGAGEGLREELRRLNAAAPYPHAALIASQIPKQSTRLLKAECLDCGYTCRVTRKWLDEAGAPWCPTHKAAMDVAGHGGEGE
jgi:hypothetical protein